MTQIRGRRLQRTPYYRRLVTKDGSVVFMTWYVDKENKWHLRFVLDGRPAFYVSADDIDEFTHTLQSIKGECERPL